MMRTLNDILERFYDNIGISKDEVESRNVFEKLCKLIKRESNIRTLENQIRNFKRGSMIRVQDLQGDYIVYRRDSEVWYGGYEVVGKPFEVADMFPIQFTDAIAYRVIDAWSANGELPEFKFSN